MKILDFLVHGSIYQALGAALLVYTSCLLLNKEPNLELIIIMFLAVYSIYNFSRITDRKEDEINVPERVSTFKKYEKYIIPSVPASYFAAIVLAYLISGFTLVFVVLVPLIIFMLYGVKVIPKSIFGFSRLKDITIVKNITISFAWAWIVTFLPFFYYLMEFTISVFAVFMFVFVVALINTVFFDLKDIKGDKIVGTKTIPVIIGDKSTLVLLTILNTVLCTFIFISTIQGWLPTLAHMVNLSTIYRYLYIYLYNKVKNVTLLYGVLVDGDCIIIGVLAFIGSLVF